MKYIDPHVHMVSRTTDDYEALALTGCVAVSEPAFWAGYDRYSAEAFADYYEHITDFEPKRSANYGIQHFAWMCLNPKEGEDRALTKEVLAMIPKYLERPNVIGIGEIGLNRVTRNEMKTLEDHLEMAVKYDQMILIHTPHLEDKFKGTKHIVECIASYSQIKPERVLIDHAEEHTLSMILDKGFWAGITLYPVTKTSSAVWTSSILKFLSCDGILYSLHKSITVDLVMPCRQYSPVEVQTSLERIIKKFVELQVEINPFGSIINPSSAPFFSASIHAAMQLCLLSELICGF